MKLYAHQQRALELLRERKRYCLFFDMGTGKTITILSVCDERRMRTLVLCPRSVMNAAWTRDAEHFPGLKVRCLWHPVKSARSAMIRTEWDIGIINYESFKIHAAELAAAGVRRLVCDESSKIKSPTTATTKAVIAFADRCDECYLLSGTPAPNNGAEYWPQVRCVSPGWAGVSFFRWAYRYFLPIERRLRDGRKVISGWRYNPIHQKEFTDRLASCSWYLPKTACVDLPDKIDKTVEVELSAAEAEAYRGAEKQLRLITGSGEARRIKAEAAMTKMRQIAGGAVLVEGEPVAIGTSKLDALMEVLEEVGKQPVVVWAEFTHEIDRISDTVHASGRTVGFIDGRTSANSAWIAKNFQDGNLDVLICHPAAAGHGITLTAASVAVYYSLSFSSEQHLQSRDRIHRIGQDRKCVYVYLIAKDTLDWTIRRCLTMKLSKGAAVLEALRMYEGEGSVKGALVSGRK